MVKLVIFIVIMLVCRHTFDVFFIETPYPAVAIPSIYMKEELPLIKLDNFCSGEYGAPRGRHKHRVIDKKMTNLLDFIKRHEGLRLNPYLDTVDKWTVFYGRNVRDVGCNPDELLFLLKNGNTQATADLFLENDIEVARGDCLYHFPDFESFSVNRKIALISVMFNLGVTRFRGFKKMIKAIENEDWDLAHNELLDSKRARQLKQRSEEEAGMFKNG